MNKVFYAVVLIEASVAFYAGCSGSAGPSIIGDDGGGGGGDSSTVHDSGGSGSSGSGGSSSSSSSSSGGNDSGDDGGSSSSSGGSSGSGSGSSSGSSSGSGSGGGDPCAAMTTRADCTMCCQTAHPSGYALLTQAIQDCVCGDAGACETTCATEYCQTAGSFAPGDSCDMCVKSQANAPGPCNMPVLAACQPDQDCAAYLMCFQPCAMK